MTSEEKKPIIDPKDLWQAQENRRQAEENKLQESIRIKKEKEANSFPNLRQSFLSYIETKPQHSGTVDHNTFRNLRHVNSFFKLYSVPKKNKKKTDDWNDVMREFVSLMQKDKESGLIVTISEVEQLSCEFFCLSTYQTFCDIDWQVNEPKLSNKK